MLKRVRPLESRLHSFPEAFKVLGGAVLGGRPINTSQGPKQVLKMLLDSSEYRAPTPRRPGKGRPLPGRELNLRNKVSRGRFTAVFFMQCMQALGVEILQIPSVEEAGRKGGAQALAKGKAHPG